MLLSSVIDKFSFKSILNDTIKNRETILNLFNNLKFNKVM